MDDCAVTECQRCPELVEARSQIVNGDGATDATLLLIGEAPGETEDEQGRPFVGRSGSVLDQALANNGLDRSSVRITNCVRCRPPENRDPTAAERSNCFDYLLAEIDGVDPELIMTLGKVPSEQLLDRSVSVTNTAGEIFDTTLDSTARRVMVNLHPAATLYDPSQQERFMQAVQRAADLVTDDETGQTRLGNY